jgi:DNA invertase Pin-like site-specific DNA recombinase
VTAIRTAVAGIAEELASPPPIRAALYCRRSQEGGRSVERQEQDGRKLAGDRGWEVTAVYKEWVSASEFSKRARKEWERLLHDIEASEFDAVIFYMEDRSARHILFAGELVHACRAAGITRVLLPSYQYDFSDSEDVARFYGEVLNAQREVAKMSKRMRRVRLEEAENGQRQTGGRRAFGEAGRRRVQDAEGNTRTVPIVGATQVERERELIREAARRVVAGDSLRGIVGDWNRQDIPSPTGGRWTTRVLRQMLLSPRLVGYRVHHGQIVHDAEGRAVRGEIEPILDVATWEAVVAVLTDPARMTTAVGRAPKYLLVGLLFCARHGSRMEGIRNGGQPAYRCPGSGKGGGTCLQRLAAPVEDLILRALFKAVENPTWHEAAAARPNGDPTRPHYERLAELTAELDVLDRRIGEAELAEELGRRPQPSSATLRQMAADRDREREQHQAAVTRLQHGRVAAAVPRNLREQWPKLSLDRRRAILAAMIERIEVHPQGRGKAFDPNAIKVFSRDRSDLTP